MIAIIARGAIHMFVVNQFIQNWVCTSPLPSGDGECFRTNGGENLLSYSYLDQTMKQKIECHGHTIE